jgi:SPP1 gp7 family putative phage head morphogenesis protein
MASLQNSKKGRVYVPITDSITINPVRMSSQFIDNWKFAVDSARSPFNPRRRPLYDLYDNISLDSQIEAVMGKRRMAITNQRITFHEKGKEGETNDFIDENILNAPWFNDLLGYSQDQIGYGHSLIELIPDKGLIKSVELINRANVFPESGIMMYNYNMLGPTLNNGKQVKYTPNPSTGILFREDPVYSDYMIEVGKKKTYGLLMIAAQYVIYKRGGFGDWAQFAELFGMPFRVGKYDQYDVDSRNKLSSALETMGGAGHVVIPNNTNLEFINNNNTGQSDVFKNLIEKCDEQISKIFLGNTMTTDNGSSRSQGEVHKKVEEGVNLNDMIRNEYMLNWDFKQKLSRIGYPVANGNFSFPRTSELGLDKRILIDMQVATQVEIEDKYWYETYGIPKPDGTGKSVKILTDPKEELAKELGPTEEKKKSKLKLNMVYNRVNNTYSELPDHSKCCGKEPFVIINASNKLEIDPIFEAIINGIYNGKIKPGSVDKKLYTWTADKLFKGVTQGFGGDFDKYEGPDKEMLSSLQNNVHVFSLFKTYQELRQANDLLTDKDGNLRSFSEFKQDVLAVKETYNVTWLNTEYDLAVASSQMASMWVDIQKTADVFPMLKYHTVGDSHVRYEHAALNGIVKPIKDEFWNTYYPPNGWHCRCDVLKVDDQETQTDKMALPAIPPMFAVNTAKEGVVFPENHPYFSVRKEDKAQAKDNWSIEVPGKPLK